MLSRGACLLLPAAATAILGACIVPVPLVEQEEGNHRLYIDLENRVIPPPTKGTVTAFRGVESEPTTFEIREVEDPDPEDDLHARWFRDGEMVVEQHNLASDSGDVVRKTLTFKHTVDQCAETLRDEDHIYVECLVSDRPISHSPSAPFRDLQPDASFVHIAWHVVFEGECQ